VAIPNSILSSKHVVSKSFNFPFWIRTDCKTLKSTHWYLWQIHLNHTEVDRWYICVPAHNSITYPSIHLYLCMYVCIYLSTQSIIYLSICHLSSSSLSFTYLRCWRWERTIWGHICFIPKETVVICLWLLLLSCFIRVNNL
jgi:hypothetical protein